MQELEQLFEDTLAGLPTEPEGGMILNALNCPRPPEQVSTCRLKVIPWSLGHCYGDSAYHDLVNFFADKDTYRRLGLLLLASVFHPNRQTTLHLTHAETIATKINLECGVADPSDPLLAGLANVPLAYGYCAVPAHHMHPLWGEKWRIEGEYGRFPTRASYQLPFLSLTNENGRSSSRTDLDSRTVIEGFGSPEATVTLAALLLDIGMPQTETSEFCLESPSGNWSVEIGSAEARLIVGYDWY